MIDVEYALSDEGQAKIREGLRELIGDCQHESISTETCVFGGAHFEFHRCGKCGVNYL